MIDDVAFYGELNPEDRAISLKGIYVLGFSFLVQTAGAIFAVADALCR